jgi:hypothetical protein
VYDCICAIVEKLFREFLLVVAEQPKSAKVRGKILKRLTKNDKMLKKRLSDLSMKIKKGTALVTDICIMCSCG